jgi:predicted DNA-binding transcriptional regulator AlpA
MSIARTDITLPAHAEFLSAAQVKARYGGVSDMWIVRKLADHDFPTPQTFGTPTRYWRVAELNSWDALMRDRTISAPKAKPPVKATAAS